MQGDPVIDELMKPLRYALDRQGISGNARTNIYNRAYEAVMNSLTVIGVMREQLSKANSRAEAAEAELAALKERTQGVCRWKIVDDNWNTWEGDCGEMWNLESGSPKDNEMVYCPKCGRKLEQPLPEPPEKGGE